MAKLGSMLFGSPSTAQCQTWRGCNSCAVRDTASKWHAPSNYGILSNSQSLVYGPYHNGQIWRVWCFKLIVGYCVVNEGKQADDAQYDEGRIVLNSSSILETASKGHISN